MNLNSCLEFHLRQNQQVFQLRAHGEETYNRHNDDFDDGFRAFYDLLFSKEPFDAFRGIELVEVDLELLGREKKSHLYEVPGKSHDDDEDEERNEYRRTEQQHPQEEVGRVRNA